jgi:hypothetical protein
MVKRKETREETIKRLSDPNYEGGNYALPENASELEKGKYDICQNIARYKRINESSLKDLAYESGISQSKLDNFSLVEAKGVLGVKPGNRINQIGGGSILLLPQNIHKNIIKLCQKTHIL